MLRAIPILLLLCSGCLERFFPNEVANGVARLCVYNLGNLLVALNHPHTYQNQSDMREECDFRTFKVTKTTTVIDNGAGLGSVTRAFSECTFDFGALGTTLAIEDACGTTTVTLFGKVRVSGTRIMHGILTGDSQMPLIPSGERGVVLNVTRALFENYRVESPTLDKAMTIASGSAAFDAEIHLAKSHDKGLCEVPLPNPTLSNIRLSDGPQAAETIVELDGPLGRFQAAIDSTSLNAQVGLYKEVHNQLSGFVTLWGKKLEVPSDGTELNPGVREEAYQRSLACNAKVLTPTSHTCSYEADAASGVARLTVRTLGNLVAAVADQKQTHARSECNLGSLHQEPTRVTQTSATHAELEWDFHDCLFDFGRNSHGLSGAVRLSGTRRIAGFKLDQNTPYPVLPGNGGVTFVFSKVDFLNLGFVAESGGPSLTLVDGELSFEAQVHLARSKRLNLCSVILPNLTLRDIRFRPNAQVMISTDAAQVHLRVQDSQVHAQVYRDGVRENRIDGAVHLFGKWQDFDEQQSILDETYTPQNFDQWIAAQADLMQPLNTDCEAFDTVENKLADGVARLTVHGLGTALRSITAHPAHAKPECNLASMAINDKTVIDAQNNRITWNFENCDFRLGNDMTTSATVTVSGSRTIEGFLTGDAHAPIVPRPGAGVEFHFTRFEFNNYNAHYSATTHLNFAKANVAFDVSVPLGRNSSNGLCTEVLPHLAFKHIRFAKDSRVALTSSDIHINGLSLGISSSDFNAQVGLGKSASLDNTLDGYLTLFGKDHSVPSDKLGLAPEAKAEVADRGAIYDCEHFERLRALNIARLLILNIGSITQEAHDEYLKGEFREKGAWLPSRLKLNCGFSSNKTRAFPSQVLRSDSEKSELHFRIEGCAVVDQPLAAAYPADCLGETTAFEGRALVSGTQIVQGRIKPYLAFFDDIVPKHPDATLFVLDKIAVTNFSSYYLAADQKEPTAKLVLRSGELSAIVNPVLAPKKGAPCEFLRSTPVVGFEVLVNKKLPAHLTLRSGEFSYDSAVTINSADLKAQNGIYQGKGNSISGTIIVNGQVFRFEQEPLNPSYNQKRFDQSYECRERFPKTNDYAIEHIIPHHEGWRPDCPN